MESIYWDAMAQTGMASVRTSIPNPEHRLKPGMLVRLDVELEPGAVPSPSRTDAGEQPRSEVALEQRLIDVERKLQRLLDEKEGRSSNGKILGRIDDLERKLDRVLKLRTDP